MTNDTQPIVMVLPLLTYVTSRQQLVQAIEGIVYHRPDCEAEPCSCGLTEALAAAKEKP